MAYTQVQLRRDTTTNWTTNDPVLATGELAVDTTLKKIKVGDGSNNWSGLPFVNDGESFVLNVSEGSAIVGTDLVRISYFPYDAILSEVILVAKTAPTGSPLIADINNGGVSIFNTPIELPISTLSVVSSNFASTTISKGDVISVDIDQRGATVRGAGIQIIINATRV